MQSRGCLGPAERFRTIPSKYFFSSEACPSSLSLRLHHVCVSGSFQGSGPVHHRLSPLTLELGDGGRASGAAELPLTLGGFGVECLARSDAYHHIFVCLLRVILISLGSLCVEFNCLRSWSLENSSSVVCCSTFAPQLGFELGRVLPATPAPCVLFQASVCSWSLSLYDGGTRRGRVWCSPHFQRLFLMELCKVARNWNLREKKDGEVRWTTWVLASSPIRRISLFALFVFLLLSIERNLLMTFHVSDVFCALLVTVGFSSRASTSCFRCLTPFPLVSWDCSCPAGGRRQELDSKLQALMLFGLPIACDGGWFSLLWNVHF